MRLRYRGVVEEGLPDKKLYARFERIAQVSSPRVKRGEVTIIAPAQVRKSNETEWAGGRQSPNSK
jgi:hypothetical protein